MGEGTGLGLSLSYDFITRGHGGMIEVETKEGGEQRLLFNFLWFKPVQNSCKNKGAY